MPDPIRRVKYTPASPKTPSSLCFRPEGLEQDVQQFHLRSAARRDAALHTAGVAEGLELSGTTGASQVTVSPGVAFDRFGRMIASPDPVLVDLTQASGSTMFLVIEYHEAEVNPNPVPAIAPCGLLEQRPVVSLKSEPGDAVVLGKVKIPAGGALQSLSADGRDLVGFSCGRLVLLRPSSGATAGQAVAATVAPIEPGVMVEVAAGPLSVKADVAVSGKVNGRDVAADGAALDGHLASHSNPHQTDAAQVGALPIGGGTLSGGLTIQGALSVSGTISGPIAAGSVGNSQIADNAVTEGKLDPAARDKLDFPVVQQFAGSIVFGMGANEPRNQGFKDLSFTMGRRVIGGWWSLQQDASGTDAFKQFSIDIPTIQGNTITFRVHKADNNPGLIRVMFVVLFV
jgi:hypothetical protein